MLVRERTSNWDREGSLVLVWFFLFVLGFVLSRSRATSQERLLFLDERFWSVFEFEVAGHVAAAARRFVFDASNLAISFSRKSSTAGFFRTLERATAICALNGDETRRYVRVRCFVWFFGVTSSC